MFYPLINLNGTDPHDLLEAYQHALKLMREAEKALVFATPHPRDYQTHQFPQNTYSNARSDHFDHVRNLQEASEYLQAVVINIHNQIAERSAQRRAE